MEQLSLFPEDERLSLEWDETLFAHVYRDRQDPSWRGMSVCLFNQVRGYRQTCRLCASERSEGLEQ